MVDMKKDEPYGTFLDFLTFAPVDSRLIFCGDFLASIKTKIITVELCLEEFINHLPKYDKENEVLRETGRVNGVQRHLLLIKYETYLNSIYSLMENLAQIIKRIYNKENLSPTFHKQMESLLNNKNNYLADEDKYSSLLKYIEIIEGLDWYKEIQGMRAEFTHFLSGLIIGVEIPGYINNPKSIRKGTPDEIRKDDIIEHSIAIIKALYDYLEKIGQLFLDYIEQEKRVQV